MIGFKSVVEAISGNFLFRASCLTLGRAFSETHASQMELKSIQHIGLDFWLGKGDKALPEGEGVLRFPTYCLMGYIVKI